MHNDAEKLACIPVPINPKGFNAVAKLPYGLSTANVFQAMQAFVDFLEFVNTQLNSKELQRLESMLMPANFSSMVGEFMKASIPKYCSTLVANEYHNGHPDLIPSGMFLRNAVQHATEGIEIKASRYLKGWQGHNAEDAWLMVFVFDTNRPKDEGLEVVPRPFKFIKVVGAQLTKSDWLFSGRSETSRRTITASVTASGFQKMESNWIYREA